MTIATLDVINAALREINVLSETDTASAEQGSDAVDKLNRMMSIWKSDSIDVGYFSLANTNGDCPIPEYAELAVINGLAITLAPRYGASASPELVAVTDSAISSLIRS
jgi:hypothetical protein